MILGLVGASPWFGDLLPELFSSADLNALGFPMSYPTSCSPQAWAAASPLLFLQTLLRFEPDIRNEAALAAVPDWIGTLRLDNIPLMGGISQSRSTSEVVRALQVPDGLTIVSDPKAATRYAGLPVRQPRSGAGRAAIRGERAPVGSDPDIQLLPRAHGGAHPTSFESSAPHDRTEATSAGSRPSRRPDFCSASTVGRRNT